MFISFYCFVLWLVYMELFETHAPKFFISIQIKSLKCLTLCQGHQTSNQAMPECADLATEGDIKILANRRCVSWFLNVHPSTMKHVILCWCMSLFKEEVGVFGKSTSHLCSTITNQINLPAPLQPVHPACLTYYD